MNNLISATIVATSLSTSAIAGFGITGKYEGTITDGTGATYTQDLDLTLTGSVADGTTVTATIENLAGGDTVTTNEVYIETTIEGFNFKGGKYKGKKGAGLLQKKSAATNKMSISTSVAGVGVKINQDSGDANATIDASASFAGVGVGVQDIADSTRFITASASAGGVDLNVERQQTATGTNTAGSISTSIGTENQVFDLVAVIVDVEDAVGVTQNDGILGDISDANNGKTVTGVVASTMTGFGMVTGKYISKNDLDTYVTKLKRGAFEYGYSKTENADGVFSGKLEVSF
jgi:hypothetical protein